MNREILFRGKRIDNGEWVEGYYCVYPKGNAEISKISRKCDNPPDCDPMWKGVLITYDVDPETVCRCTGRKDISGKLMYQGDIFESHQGTQILANNMVLKYGVYQAYCPADKEFMDNVGFYVEAKGFPQMPIGSVEDYAKVIGNIFDNPELLEQGGSI